MRRVWKRQDTIARRFGPRLAWLALALNLLGPYAFPIAPGIGGETIVICTERGLQTIAIDENGRKQPPVRSGEICLFCPPLLKFGGATPVVASPFVLHTAEESSVEFFDVAQTPRRIQARLIAAPRAPPSFL